MISLSYYIVVFILLLSYFQGVLATLGITESISLLIINMAILFLFLLSMVFISIDKKKIKTIGFLPLSLMLFVMILSFLLNDVSLLQLIFFVKIFFLPILFFIALFNIPFSLEIREKILKLIMILFLLQIPASIIKIYLVGFTEDYIGTISIPAGSIASILPMIAIAYILSYSMNYKNKKILNLLPLFLIVSIASSKMAIIIYIIAIAMLVYLSSSTSRFFSMKTIKWIISIVGAGIVLFYAVIVLTPRANPDGVAGGSFDLMFALDFIETYTSRDKKPGFGRLKGVARKDAPLAVYNILESKGILHILIGTGPGDIVLSKFLPYANPLEDKYHLGYGARTGFIWIFMQMGIIGTIFYLWFQIRLFKRIHYKYKTHKNIQHRTWLLTAYGTCLIFFIDYFTYSSTLIIQPAMVLSYFYIIYFAIQLEYVKDINEPK